MLLLSGIIVFLDSFCDMLFSSLSLFEGILIEVCILFYNLFLYQLEHFAFFLNYIMFLVNDIL